MNYLTMYPPFFAREGFGTLMGHYAAMYCIAKDSGFIPTILDINFDDKNIITAMKYFNQSFKEHIYTHNDAFLNFHNIFYTLNESELAKIQWVKLNVSTLTYDKIINTLKNINNHVSLLWSLNYNLYAKYLNEIINYLYIFNNNVIVQSSKLLPITDKNIVAVCVRNEYKYIQCPHIRLTLNYYEQAMNQFDKNTCKYLIFSDFIDETKNNFKALEEKFDIEYFPPTQSAIGLCSMSLCNHIICANSSFSYWASILNKKVDKKIVCSPYFIEPSKDPRQADLLNFKWYPKEWTALDII